MSTNRRPIYAAVLAALLVALLALPAPGAAQERIGFGYSHLQDGNCGIAQRTMVGDYSRTSDTLALRGRVRTEPAGGDCRADSFAYDVRIARHFRVGGGVDATVEFAAAEQSTAAPYILADEAGAILLRGDGGALYGAHLPAGSAQTIVAAVGVSVPVSGMRLGAFVNLAPIDWSEHAPGRTVRLAWDGGWRGMYFETAVDVGADHFGSVSTGYRHTLSDSRFDVGADVTHSWGLTAVDNGAPLSQMIAGSAFLRDGPPQDDSTVLSLTLGYRLVD